VPRPNVVLTDQDKGFTFQTTTDTTGSYLFRSVPPGVYSVTAEMPSFEKTARPNVKVNVNDNVTVNITLKVGVLDPNGGGAGSVGGSGHRGCRFINDLPLVDREVVLLTSLAPGVTTMGDDPSAVSTARAPTSFPTAVADRRPTF